MFQNVKKGSVLKEYITCKKVMYNFPNHELVALEFYLY